MAGELADQDFVVRLHLPPARREPVPEAGRDGGFVLAAIGLLFAVAAALFWVVRRDPALTWACLGLVGLNVGLMVTGLTLALRRRHDDDR